VSLKNTGFTEMLIEANDLDPGDFRSWVFCSGMRFNSPDKWWGDHGRRDFPHEGVDLCLYQDADGQVRRVGENTRIPVMHDGVVKALFTDYLGQAVILEHAGTEGGKDRLLSVYAHTRPEKHITPGTVVKAGEIIAVIADTRRSKAKIHPHLHVSFGIPSPALVYDPFVWNSMRDPGQVALMDPLGAIDWPYRVLAATDQNFPCGVKPTKGAVS
jgi:murein DD-endopeptidase MepM/ murein hydrolase activator NlpD